MAEQQAEQLELGQEIEATIQGYSHQGQGVARIERQVVFIPGALRGEQVRALVSHRQKGVFQAQLIEVLQASDNRREPCCPVYAGCGGCSLQHLAYPEQLALKQEIVANALCRLGKLPVAGKINPVVGMDRPWHYRNKGLFQVAFVQGQVEFGFQQEGSHATVAHTCSLLFPEAVCQLLTAVKAYINQHDGEAVWGGLSRLLVRLGIHTGELMLVLLGNEKMAAQQQLLKSLYCYLQEQFTQLKVYGYSVDQGEATPAYQNLQLYSDENTITETLNGITFQISAASFFQVNTLQAEVMLQLIQRLLGPAANAGVLFDIYCGIGTIGLSLANAAQRLVGIEVVPQAVQDAKQNARQNGIAKAHFYCGKAENLFQNKQLQQEKQQAGVASTVVIDPPRKGCQPVFLQALTAFAPSQILYVSCNPATLARDLAFLCSQGYAVDGVQPIDMFPQSWHVECVCLMTRTSK